MSQIFNNLPDVLYETYLHTIGNVKFTRREVDIIACLLSAKTIKAIAHLLSTTEKPIGVKSIDTHILNIKRKINGNYKNQIVAFIEKAPEYQIVHSYYLALLAQNEFGTLLTTLQKYLTKKSDSIKILVISENHKLLGKLLDFHLQKFCTFSYIVASEENYENKVFENQCSNTKVILCIDKIGAESNFPQNSQNHPVINISDYENCYSLFCAILKSIFNDKTQIIEETTASFLTQNHNINHIHTEHVTTIPSTSTTKLKFAAIAISCSIVFMLAILYTYFSSSTPQIRSDLILPKQAALLERPEMISKINEVHSSYASSNKATIIALIGPGGAGKTILARIYAKLQTPKILWEINAESVLTLRDSFSKLALNIALNTKDIKFINEIASIEKDDLKLQKVMQYVKNYLSSNNEWILIYDNVEDMLTIQKYLALDATTWGSGFIILTSRNRNIVGNKYIDYAIFLDPLTDKQKIDLFNKIINNKDSEELVHKVHYSSLSELVRNIPPFPLDISAAAYYLKATKSDPILYLNSISNHSKSFAQLQSNIQRNIDDYSKTRYEIVTLSVHQMLQNNPEFLKLILLTSLLDSSFIPIDLLKEYSNTSVVDSFIIHLKRYSFIEYEATSPLGITMDIHRDIKSLILTYILSEYKQDCLRLIPSLTKALNLYAQKIVSEENQNKISSILPHYEELLNHYKTLRLNETLIDFDLGLFYYKMGNDTKAKELLEVSSSLLNQNSSDLALAYSYLGNIYRRLGEYSDARSKLEQSIKIYKKYPECKVEIANTLTHLGIVYRMLGQYRKAEALFTQGLSIYEKLPNQEENIATTSMYLGVVYMKLGEYLLSQTLLEKSFNIHSNHQEKQLSLARISGHLGTLYGITEEYSKASQLLEKSLYIYKKFRKEDHIDVAWISANLSIVYNKQHMHIAIPLMTKSIAIYKKHFGNHHLEVARMLNHLGEMYSSQKDYTQAKNLFFEALKIFQSENHHESYISLESLGNLYLKMGIDFVHEKNSLIQQARDSYNQSLQIASQHFPITSNHIQRLQSKLDKIGTNK